MGGVVHLHLLVLDRLGCVSGNAAMGTALLFMSSGTRDSAKKPHFVAASICMSSLKVTSFLKIFLPAYFSPRIALLQKLESAATRGAPLDARPAPIGAPGVRVMKKPDRHCNEQDYDDKPDYVHRFLRSRGDIIKGPASVQ
jgi:hypothetical protein